MGAYKDYKENEKKLHQDRENNQKALLLEAAGEVAKASRIGKDFYDSEDIVKNPEKYTEIFTKALCDYARDIRSLDPQAWDKLSMDDKKIFLRGMGYSEGVIKSTTIAVASGEIHKPDKLFQKDEFRSYHLKQQEDARQLETAFSEGFNKDRKKTIDEAISELEVGKVIEPRALDMQNIMQLEQMVGTHGTGKNLEEYLKKFQPNFLKSHYQGNWDDYQN